MANELRTKDGLIGELSSANLKIHLRGVAERAIDYVWYYMNHKSDRRVEREMVAYKNIRKDMVKAGVPLKDISDYDNRFVNLPWAECGYQKPTLEELK